MKIIPGTSPHNPARTPRRLQVVQKLFGEGFNQPGGEELMKPLIAPLGLNPNLSTCRYHESRAT